MAKRRAGDAFGESYTFPGGVVDDDEALACRHVAGRTAEEADRLFGEAEGLRYYSAAIRELFEETGILLAREKRNGAACDIASLSAFRRSIDRGRLAWSDFLQQNQLVMACDSLHHFAHWETPTVLPKRWSTRFFLARMPEGQEASLDSNELTDICWMPAIDILRASRDGLMRLPYPTMRILKDLADFSTIGEMLDWADALSTRQIEKILPVRITKDGKTKWLIKGVAE